MKYVTKDGKSFDSVDQALAHETTLYVDTLTRNKKRYDSYLASSYGKVYPMDEYGIFEVRGESSDPDYGSRAPAPLLGFIEGRFSDVLNWAVSQDKWVSWGGGGSIVKIEITKL